MVVDVIAVVVIVIVAVVVVVSIAGAKIGFSSAVNPIFDTLSKASLTSSLLLLSQLSTAISVKGEMRKDGEPTFVCGKESNAGTTVQSSIILGHLINHFPDGLGSE